MFTFISSTPTFTYFISLSFPRKRLKCYRVWGWFLLRHCPPLGDVSLAPLSWLNRALRRTVSVCGNLDEALTVLPTCAIWRQWGSSPPASQKALFGTNCGWLLYDHESRDHAPTLGISFVSFLFLFRPQWTIPLGFFYWSFYIFELNIGELEVLALGPLLFAVCWFSGQKLNSSPGSLQMMNSIWIIDLQSFTCT